jgi:hypothetical protein
MSVISGRQQGFFVFCVAGVCFSFHLLRKTWGVAKDTQYLGMSFAEFMVNAGTLALIGRPLHHFP